MKIIRASRPNCDAIRIELEDMPEREHFSRILEYAEAEIRRHPFGLRSYHMRDVHEFIHQVQAEL